MRRGSGRRSGTRSLGADRRLHSSFYQESNSGDSFVHDWHTYTAYVPPAVVAVAEPVLTVPPYWSPVPEGARRSLRASLRLPESYRATHPSQPRSIDTSGARTKGKSLLIAKNAVEATSGNCDIQDALLTSQGFGMAQPGMSACTLPCMRRRRYLTACLSAERQQPTVEQRLQRQDRTRPAKPLDAVKDQSRHSEPPSRSA